MIARNRAFAFGLTLISAGWSAHASAAPTFTTFDVPGAGTGANQGTLVSAFGFPGVLAGSYIDSSNKLHAYIRTPDNAYSFFDVSGQSGANAQSHQGKAVGFVIDNVGTHGALEYQGTLTQFDVSGSPDTEAEGVNKKGKIVGIYLDSSNAVHGFLRSRGGGIRTFDAPGAGTASGQGTTPFAISVDSSTAGYVVGSDGVRHGFVRDGTGVFTVFDPPNAVRTTAICMDDNHDDVGGSFRDAAAVIHAFVRSSAGTFTVFDAPGAGTGALQGTNLHQINNRHAMVGSYSDSAGVNHGYLRNAGGRVIQFDAPGAHMVSGQGTIAQTINDQNQIGGYYYDAAGATHGFIRNP
jgi:hypothetical protein